MAVRQHAFRHERIAELPLVTESATVVEMGASPWSQSAMSL
jgi:hypothetical protein